MNTNIKKCEIQYTYIIKNLLKTILMNFISKCNPPETETSIILSHVCPLEKKVVCKVSRDREARKLPSNPRGNGFR